MAVPIAAGPGRRPRIDVVVDNPRRHLGRRAGRAVSALAGVLLTGAGLAATLVAVPATLAVVGVALTYLTEEDTQALDELPLRTDQLVGAWAVAVVVSIVGIRGGLRLLRGRRRTVLFLRRFGFDDATSVVTFAAAQTVGHGWRLLTLDDDEIVAVGSSAADVVSAADRVLATSRRVGAVAGGVLRRLSFLLAVPWVVVGIVILDAGGPAEALRSGALEPYVALLAATMDGDLPLGAIGFDLPGIFAFGLVSVAAWLAGLAVTMALLLAALALSPLLVLTSATAQSVREAERTKTRTVRDEVELELAAADVAARNRKVFAPRLVVLRVATPVWREAVRRLAGTSRLALIDVSQPTDHLLWEIEELTVRSPTTCLLVGELGRLRELTGAGAAELDPGSVEARTLLLLDGRRVLGYTTDRAGVRRFARALRADLYAADDDGPAWAP